MIKQIENDYIRIYTRNGLRCVILKNTVFDLLDKPKTLIGLTVKISIPGEELSRGMVWKWLLRQEKRGILIGIRGTGRTKWRRK
ncbi:MAG: hypothetical protein HKP62_01455 [Sulfurovum sp.]|nr:hypothetical protein [Sulfurovum sp.]NNJ44661.1 hypothetical protein [Sulfurovum sp.]